MKAQTCDCSKMRLARCDQLELAVVKGKFSVFGSRGKVSVIGRKLNSEYSEGMKRNDFEYFPVSGVPKYDAGRLFRECSAS